jgi:hypothetical protein
VEPIKDKVRLKLIFGKFPVIKAEHGQWGTKFVIQLPHGITLHADSSVPTDVQVGHLLTLYTEVLADAKPSATPIQ